MCAYIDAYNYRTSFADLLPLVFANMLSINLVIIEKLDTQAFQHFIISGRGSGSDHFLFIYKYGQHYDGLSFASNFQSTCFGSNNSNFLLKTMGGDRTEYPGSSTDGCSVGPVLINKKNHTKSKQKCPPSDSLLDFKFNEWNIHGLTQEKLDLLYDYLKDFHMNVFSETWTESKDKFQLKGFAY